MKEHGYLGDWSHTGEKILPSECTDPFNCSLTLTPPDWLDEELKLIQSNREIPALENKESKVATIEEFKEIFKASKLTVRQFGNHLGITGPMVSLLLNQRDINNGSIV
jgi:hypothetical protein